MSDSYPRWQFFNPRGKIVVSGESLPHWQQGKVVQFITFRLGDSLPKNKLRELEELRKKRLSTDCKLSEKSRAESMVDEMDHWLDKGLGCSLLSDSDKRAKLLRTLLLDDGKRAIFISLVIMPNHVHLLFEPMIELPKLLQSWKSISARQIANGPIWQSGYYDRMARNMNDLITWAKYIRENPKRLAADSYTLWECEWIRKVLG